jgi:hypothetical protein
MGSCLRTFRKSEPEQLQKRDNPAPDHFQERASRAPEHFQKRASKAPEQFQNTELEYRGKRRSNSLLSNYRYVNFSIKKFPQYLNINQLR